MRSASLPPGTCAGPLLAGTLRNVAASDRDTLCGSRCLGARSWRALGGGWGWALGEPSRAALSPGESRAEARPPHAGEAQPLHSLAPAGCSVGCSPGRLRPVPPRTPRHGAGAPAAEAAGPGPTPGAESCFRGTLGATDFCGKPGKRDLPNYVVILEMRFVSPCIVSCASGALAPGASLHGFLPHVSTSALCSFGGSVRDVRAERPGWSLGPHIGLCAQ